MSSFNFSNDYSNLISGVDTILGLLKDYIESQDKNLEYKCYVFSENDWKDSYVWVILHQDWFMDMMKVWFEVEVRFGNYDGVKILKDWSMEEKVVCEYVILSWE